MKNDDWKKLVLELKEISESKGITQTEIAEKLNCHQQHISRFFNTKCSPSLDLFLQVAKANGVEVSITSASQLI